MSVKQQWVVRCDGCRAVLMDQITDDQPPDDQPGLPDLCEDCDGIDVPVVRP